MFLKNFNKIFFCLIICLLFCNSKGQAQPPKGEVMKSIVIAYITKQLELTPEEAQGFWPVFYKYEAEIKSARQNFSDELVLEEEVLKIRKSYKAKFKAAGLSDDKVNKFFKVEKTLIQKIKQNLQNRRDNRSGGWNRDPNPPKGQK